MNCQHGQMAQQCELRDRDSEIENLRDAAEHALRVLEEVALDLANDQLAQYREMYRGGYKPHRVKGAEDDLMAVQNSIAELKAALGKKDKTTDGPVKVPLARKGAELLRKYGPFTVGPNEASTLFSELCKHLLIDGLTFHDSRASALTWLSRRMDVLTLSRISRHQDLNILMDSYYRETPEQVAARIKR